MASFTCQTTDLGSGRFLTTLEGDLDMAACERAWGHVEPLLTCGLVLVLDLSRLALADSSAVRFLLTAQRAAQERGVCLRLLCPRPWLRERLSLAGVLEHFDIHRELAAALETGDANDSERHARR